MENNDEIRKTLKKILDDINTTSLYFRFLEEEYKKEQQRLKEVAGLIVTVSPWLKQQPHGDVFENILKSMISMTKNYNDNFQLVTYILDILALKIQGLELSQHGHSINFNQQQQILTEENRKNLEKLKNYFLQKKDEDIS